jgi:uncharacterized protein (TIGR02270 family)
MANADTGDPEGDVLWDVVEEHLAEAQFGVEELQRSFERPVATLESTSRGIEPRLLAHIDGLVVGGAPVRVRLLDPIVDAADPAEPVALVVAGFVLAISGALDPLLSPLAHQDDGIRQAAVQALALAASRRVDGWVEAKLSGALAPRARASLFEVAWRRGVRLAPLVAWLQDPDPLVIRWAAHAAGHADAAVHGPVLEYLLEHQEKGVREAALVPSLAWGSSRASQCCRQWGLDRQKPQTLAMILLAALEGPAVHEEIAALFAYPTHVQAAIVALGHSGNVRMLPRLLEHVEGKAPLLRKLAAQSISLITGMNLGDVALGVASSAERGPGANGAEGAEARQALPPLEEDDLDADLAPLPEDALPDPDPHAVRSHCRDAMVRMNADPRWICGKPFSIATMLEALQVLPLRMRHSLAMVVFARTRAAVWVDTRALPGEQARRLRGFAVARPAPAGRW